MEVKVSLSNELIEGILFPIVGAVIFALAAFLVPELVSIWSPKKKKDYEGWLVSLWETKEKTHSSYRLYFRYGR